MSLLSLHQPDFALHSRNLFVDEGGGGRREKSIGRSGLLFSLVNLHRMISCTELVISL